MRPHRTAAHPTGPGAALPLPELPLPPDAEREVWEALARSHRTPVLWAEGNPHAPVAIVLDNPLAARRRPNLYPLVVEDLRRAHDALAAGKPAVGRR